jgi:hypothetical protein
MCRPDLGLVVTADHRRHPDLPAIGVLESLTLSSKPSECPDADEQGFLRADLSGEPEEVTELPLLRWWSPASRRRVFGATGRRDILAGDCRGHG